MNCKLSFYCRVLLCAAAMFIIGAAQNSYGQDATLQTFLTRDEAVRLALAQASSFQQAQFDERIAAEEVKQSRAAFLPRMTINPGIIYTSPSAADLPQGASRQPSFLGADAISVYQNMITMSGELDMSGRLRAALKRNSLLLEAAKAGTESARRALIEATDESYYGVSLTAALRQAAEQNLSAADEFERITKLLLDGGEVAEVDLKRAQLQTNTRRDELEQAKANEKTAADLLRSLIGYSFAQPIETTSLMTAFSLDGELSRFSSEEIANRPELGKLLAEQRAAKEEAKAARAERLPQFIYSIDGGFISDSLRLPRIADMTGMRATVGITIPLFDWGASRSRQKQAELRAQSAESSRILAQRQFAFQFSSNMAQAKSAAARVQLATNNVKDAESVLEISITRYRAGEARIIEVTDAQNQLVLQRSALYQAVYDYRIAEARLRQATGK